ncbi:rnd efflux pump membrane fusion protein barrel-sandwich domain [Lucifera butyrica]|uniref:Rnd efflux pump membrane fusion protein barrel-sandwich domain n=1 Tax=Lucifera butyrica TaxID=1351585 RepID=A0A498RBD2_9FIRM|nr:efflux RND transporter periplasmic adaptor subunit [Lucifera butyrica]VBB07443.1 rnd efflux pump membrane fusion protein barrel-sandwich domain [Lucifera butyrica]
MSLKDRKYQWPHLKLAMLLVLVTLTAAGCGNKPAAQGPAPVGVKAMQVIQKDTPITYEYVGQVVAKNEVKIMAKVAGNIVAKMVNGGETVHKGQPLFQIDDKQYKSAILADQAALAQSEAAYNNARMDAERYQQLVAQDAVAQQTADTADATAKQDAAAVEANRAKLQQAQEDLQDTLIVSPVDGRIDVNDLSAGNYAVAGSTVLATVSSVDPVWVQFSMSENDYLKFMQTGNGTLPSSFKDNLKLTLSDGSTYPLTGKVEQIDRGINQNTGTITLKAVFSNPQKLLLPGMFARVVSEGEVRKGALLIPQRAVQQMLGKNFVTVVAEGDKAESRAVKLGPKVGDLWIVEDGLAPTDRVVVEGLTKLQPGAALKVTMIGLDDLKNPAQQ